MQRLATEGSRDNSSLVIERGDIGHGGTDRCRQTVDAEVER